MNGIALAGRINHFGNPHGLRVIQLELGQRQIQHGGRIDFEEIRDLEGRVD